MSTDAFRPSAYPRLLGEDSERERERARRRGYADGHAEGFRVATAAVETLARRQDAVRRAREAEADASLGRVVSAVEAAAAQFAAHRDAVAAQEDQLLLRRAIELAELIVAGELTGPGRAAIAAVERALAAARTDDGFEVRLHPEDLEALELSGALPDGVPLRADDDLARGDAIVVVADGLIDARIGSAFERARRSILEEES
ncbi:FliH/SctL family protein [Microbacterium sp. CIAB417]|uniref:FliH/SctL family protein n=1 Tax=Microbacterium sp. CIAB417 TaxID=2860287 RepID=UPI001FADCB9D|nr:FliH/SctL family protein [Microbacterium sp. CIAB417]